jgi:hypothetical protein
MRMVSLSDVGCEAYMDDICPKKGTVFGALKANGLQYGFWTTDMYDSCSVWYVGTDPGDTDPGYVNGYVRNYAYNDFLCVR